MKKKMKRRERHDVPHGPPTEVTEMMNESKKMKETKKMGKKSPEAVIPLES